MKFDYRIGTEATFQDWEQDGCEKAAAILAELEKNEEQKIDISQINKDF